MKAPAARLLLPLLLAVPWAFLAAVAARRDAAAVFLALLALAPLARCGLQLARQKEGFAGNCQNINEVQVELGRWVKSAVLPDEAVVVIDAGAIRYFGERRTIDLFGLNDHELAFDQPLRERL